MCWQNIKGADFGKEKTWREIFDKQKAPNIIPERKREKKYEWVELANVWNEWYLFDKNNNFKGVKKAT